MELKTDTIFKSYSNSKKIFLFFGLRQHDMQSSRAGRTPCITQVEARNTHEALIRAHKLGRWGTWGLALRVCATGRALSTSLVFPKKKARAFLSRLVVKTYWTVKACTSVTLWMCAKIVVYFQPLRLEIYDRPEQYFSLTLNQPVLLHDPAQPTEQAVYPLARSVWSFIKH